jgi:transposase
VQLAQSLAQLRRAEVAAAVNSEPGDEHPSELRHPAQTRSVAQTQLARQAERTARYEQIVAVQKQGLKSAEIALQLGVTPRTVQRWIVTGNIPYSGPRRQRPRLIDPYEAYLLSLWHQGCRNGAQRERELRAKGYKGSGRALYRYLERLDPSGSSARKQASPSTPRQTVFMQPNPLLTLSAQKATWLFFRRSEDLKEEEQEHLRLLRQASPQLDAAYHLVEAFLHMVRERTGEQLDAWLAFAEASHLEVFESFITAVQQDKDAVLAGLTLPWSNGPLEGNVNRLKLIKRSMYGRAEIDLLKHRVLSQSKKNQDRKNKRKNHQAQPVDDLKKTKSMQSDTNFHCTTFGISKVA